MDRITEVDQGIGKAIGMTMVEEITKVMQEHIKGWILVDRIIEVDIKEVIRTKIMKEVEVDYLQIAIEGMTELVVTVGQGQEQEWVLIETELGVISLDSITISWRIVQQSKK